MAVMVCRGGDFASDVCNYDTSRHVGVMGPFDVAGVMGLCDGVLFLLMRSVTSTSSPTRKTAPEGPAQAYWPKTGLSGWKVRFRVCDCE
jgi:hypothetical protein